MSTGPNRTASADRAEVLRQWCGRSTELFLRSLDAVGDQDLPFPSRLPGWSRATLVAHVHRNAEALMRLLQWAATGVETPMYASAEQRDHDIAIAAGWGTDRLREEVAASSELLAAAMKQLPAVGWHSVVRTATGREVLAVEIPWLRVRETGIHAFDLGGDDAFVELGDSIVRALLDDVTGFRRARGSDPVCGLVADEDGTSWTIGDDPTRIVRGSLPALAAWVTGRSAGAGLRVDDDGALPNIGPWI